MLASVPQMSGKPETPRDSFLREAESSDHEIEAGGDVYAAADVHSWMERLARGEHSEKFAAVATVTASLLPEET
jgi:hypothetical protein